MRKNYIFLVGLSVLSMSLAGCDKKPHEHIWGTPTYTWAEDYSSCTAERVCTSDPTHIESETVNSTYKIISNAECDADGVGRYTVAFENASFSSQTHDTVIEAVGHDYQFDSFVWTDFTAQAKYVCLHNGEHVKYFDAEITDDVTLEPKCVEKGTKIYYASYDGHADSKTEILPALGHDLVHHDGLSPTCLENGYAAYDTCTRCDYSTYRTLNSIGHNWGDPIYTWAEDYSSCTAERVCLNDENHKETETKNSTYRTATNPTLNGTDGSGEYQVSFSNPAFSKQFKNIVLENGQTPKLSPDGETLTFGLYPQKRVSDSAIIENLNILKKKLSPHDGYYFYDGGFYMDAAANWFKCEPIEWNILSIENGKYLLLSKLLLDNETYISNNSTRTIDGKTVFPNNYKHSKIREWLNNKFYNLAFYKYGKNYIQLTNVDNSAATTDLDNSSSNRFWCEDTQDNVFLLSYKDYLNSDYGFSTSKNSNETRYCQPTDWAKANGSYYSDQYKNNGIYWTRTPYCFNYNDTSHVFYISNGGTVSHYLDDTQTDCSVRPAITIKL